MSERPPITGKGTIVEIHESGRLYQIEMKNGHRAYAVIPKGGPLIPKGENEEGIQAVVEYSSYDMTRCKILEWIAD